MAGCTFGYDAGRITGAAERMRAMPPELARQPRRPGVWSRLEILGHLIDSACNNHRRFVIAQAMDDLVFEGYAHERWVSAQRYADADWRQLVDLWEAYNLHLLRIVAAIPEGTLNEPRARHSFHQTAYREVPADQPSTLGYLVEDYFAHLEHHLKQILEPVPVG